MLIKQSGDIPWSEVTPKSLYLNRRKFMTNSLAAGVGMWMGQKLAERLSASASLQAGTKLNGVRPSSFSTNEKQTPYNDVTHYNNFYEFGVAKEQPAVNARDFKTRPWQVGVEGAVNKPRTFDLEEILKLATLEERIYRHRCVEGWSIVVPWIGYSLNVLLKQVEPTDKARFVAFQSFYDNKQMPEGRHAGIPLPYVEGLRIDEALHPLTLLCVGMYGEDLPNQDGAPVRLVVPWKYGFKSIKSLVKIRLVEKQPPTTWNLANSHEYGFYSNVNPQVDHPRWSQAKERRLGEFFRRPTLLFNGYGEQVAALYSGMDLRRYF